MASQLDTDRTTTTVTRDFHYKGKATHRGWAQLPEEIVRWIATQYLFALASGGTHPVTWEHRDLWHQRMVFNMLRDGLQLEKNMMWICMGWHKALESHLFWRQAVSLIDPMDHFVANMYAAKPVPVADNRSSSAAAAALIQPRLTAWRHFRNIMNCSCVICRINAPALSLGLGNVHHTKERRSAMLTPCMGWINVCRDHERRKAAFCGLCLREAPMFESATATATLSQLGYHPTSQAHAQNMTNMVMNVAVVENEDEDTWPHVEATCRNCRLEYLWRKTSGNERDREAILGPTLLRTVNAFLVDQASSPFPISEKAKDEFPAMLKGASLNSSDWETRQTVECFLDLGEGTISEVLGLAREKYWMEKHTKLGDMMMQAVAARKWSQNPGDLSGRASPDRGHQSRAVGGHGERRDLERSPNIGVELEEAATVTSTRTLSSAASDISSTEHNARLISRTNPQPGAPRAGVLNHVQHHHRNDDMDEYESVAEEYEESELASDDEDEDTSILQNEENGVRDLALGDWARARILDGFWISPADTYYHFETGYPPPAPRWQRMLLETEEGGIEDKKGEGWVRAVHPCPWTIDKDSEESANARVAAEVSCSSPVATKPRSQVPKAANGEQEQESHPHWAMVVADIPPSYALCEQAFIAHGKMLRTILLPAMKNVVRKIVMECASSGRREDPAIVASRMSLDDVVKILREEEAVWIDGVDWAQISKNKTQESRGGAPTSTASASPPADEDEYGGEMYRTVTTASASSGSGSGSGPSPVLSTTTLATTPSPHFHPSKRLSDEKMSEEDEEGVVSEEQDEDSTPKIVIPVSPILDQPKILRSIPYVPISVARFPQYTTEALKTVWREACAPLYQCRCSICERASAQQAAIEAQYEQARNAEYQQAQAALQRSPQVQRSQIQHRHTTPAPPSREARQQHQQQQLHHQHPQQLDEEVVEQVSLSELNDDATTADFDSDDVVEIDFRVHDDGQNDAQDGIENASYYFAKERERHSGKGNVYPVSTVRSHDEQKQEAGEAGQPVEWNNFDDEELRSFGLARDSRGNVFEITGDEVADAAAFQSRVEVVESPLPSSEEAGDTTTTDDWDSSAPTSRKRSCDHLDDLPTVRLVNDSSAGTPKRARISPPAPISRGHTPARRASARPRSLRRSPSPLLAPIELTPSAGPPKRKPDAASPIPRKRGSEEADTNPALDLAPNKKKARVSLPAPGVVADGGVTTNLIA